MSRPTSKLSAFASATEQQQALDAWRAKSDARSANVDKLARKINSHKKQSQENGKRLRWLQDRDALNKEQDACEEQLAQVLRPLLHLVRDELFAGAATTHALRSDLRERLEPISGGLRSLAVARAATADTTEADRRARTAEIMLALNDQMERLHEALARYRQSLTAVGAAQGEEDAGEPLSPSSQVDLDAVLSATVRHCAELQESHAGEAFAAVHAAFAQAVSYEQSRCQARAGELDAARPPRPADAAGSAKVQASVTLILKIADTARMTTGSTAASRDVAGRVAEAFPRLSHVEVDAAIAECQQTRAVRQQQRLLARDYRRAAASLLSSYEAALEAQGRADVLGAELARERAAREAAHADGHARLAALRDAHDETLRARRAGEEAAEADRQQRRQAQEAARREELEQRLQRLAEFMTARDEARRQEAALAALRAGEAAALKAAQSEQNGKRVAFRQAEYEERRAEELARERELEGLRAERAAALERFFAAVERRLDVHPSRERLEQGTAASTQAAAYVTLAAATAAPITGGYSDDQIMRDPRVRLYQALLEAGLHTTQYGREAVAARGCRVAPAQRISGDNPMF